MKFHITLFYLHDTVRVQLHGDNLEKMRRGIERIYGHTNWERMRTRYINAEGQVILEEERKNARESA